MHIKLTFDKKENNSDDSYNQDKDDNENPNTSFP